MKKTCFLFSCFVGFFMALQGQPTLLTLTSQGQGSGNGTISKYDAATNTITAIHTFGSEGMYPVGNLCKVSSGKFYAMTNAGGTLGYGVIFSFDEVNSGYTVVHNFNNTNGSEPAGSLILASDGKLYGITTRGGTLNIGVLFSFDPLTETYTVLKNFDYNGNMPTGSLIQASDGKLYGMTWKGGPSNAGVIFSFDITNSVFTIIKNFANTDGAEPRGSLIQASDGKLYGMTSYGGIGYRVDFYIDPITNIPTFIITPGDGVIFSFDITTSSYNVLYNFNIMDGANPNGALLQASDGKFYGTASRKNGGYGVVFSFDLPASNYVVLKSFDSYPGGADPNGSLTQGSDGKLYGTLSEGGGSFRGYGAIFSLDAVTGNFIKQGFTGPDGARPFADLVEIQNIQLNCVANTTADAAEGSCSAIVSQIDPQITPAGSAVNYTLTGATTGNGTGTASGFQFNVGTTAVTYTSTDDPSKLCSFIVTVNPTSVFYRDADIDGYGNAAEKIYACTQPAGYVPDNTDCNDNDASVHIAITYYADADHDGFGDPSSSTSLCQLTPPPGYVTNNSDCDDTQKLYQDSDGDGYGSTILVACGGVTNNTDCNDNNTAIHAPVTFYRDADNDGYGNILDITTLCSVTPPAGYVVNSTDCDDSKATTHPGATEICNNGIDDNCNGQIDENCCTISVSVGPDIRSYFGYTPEQCKSITAVITNGTPPYTYNWSLDRPLLFNVITPSGDESMTGTNTSTVTVCLLDSANLCVTVTDANGCIFTDCAMVFAEDVRCFSGNGSAQKVRLCHAGSTTCVNQNTVSQHLSHGDYLGYCITQAATITNANLETSNEKIINNPGFVVYPNPNAGDFTASIKLTDMENNNGEMQIINVSGQIIKRVSVNNQSIINVSLDKSGMYLVKLILGNRVMTKKIVVIR